MKKRSLLIAAIILLAAGVGLLSFPTASNTIGAKISRDKTVQYEERLKNIVTEKSRSEAIADGDISEDDTETLFLPDLERLYSDSLAYNEELKKNQAALLKDENAYRAPALRLSDYGVFDGVYAYISIPKIGMYLPVYLGANGENMSYGAAHMTYTSLPLGGESTNCVLVGHTGYIGRIFFDDLLALSEGDEVVIRSFWSTLSYRVVKTEVHKPTAMRNIYITEGRDMLTMITCISDGEGGFNRFHVVCERAG